MLVDRPAFFVDFGAGVHPLVETCRTVLVILGRDDQSALSRQILAMLEAWVPRFDAWYRRVAGIDRASRLHLLYRREVGIATPTTVGEWHLLRPIAEACRVSGIGFGLTVDLRDAIDNVDDLRAVVADQLLSGVALAFDAHAPFVRASPVVRCLVDGGLRVNFVGPVEPLVASGLIGAAGLDARQFGIEPVTDQLPRGAMAAGDSCFRRFRLIVDEKGDLYPCIGLVGVADGRLGHISDAISDTALDGRAARLDFEALARSGPALADESGISASETGLPVVCDRHRRALLEQRVAP